MLGEFEAELHRHILDMAGRGFGMDVRAVKDLAVKMARVMGKASFVGSNGWLRRFKKRSRLSVRIAEGFERTRAGAMNPTNLNKYFELLRAGRELVKSNSGGVLTPKQIYTMDESGTSMNPTRRQIMCSTGERLPQIIASSNREHITVCAVQRADGYQLPPFFAIKGVRKVADRLKDGRLKGIPLASDFVMTAKGYITDDTWVDFAEWMVDIVNSEHNETPELWKLLILDGYGSHTMQPDALQLFLGNRIHVMTIPAHTSSHLQIADVCLFGPVKQHLRRLCSDYNDLHPAVVLDRWDYLKFIWEAMQKVDTGSIRNGFRKWGIEPLNMNWVEENTKATEIAEMKVECGLHEAYTRC